MDGNDVGVARASGRGSSGPFAVGMTTVAQVMTKISVCSGDYWGWNNTGEQATSLCKETAFSSTIEQSVDPVKLDQHYGIKLHKGSTEIQSSPIGSQLRRDSSSFCIPLKSR